MSIQGTSRERRRRLPAGAGIHYFIQAFSRSFAAFLLTALLTGTALAQGASGVIRLDPRLDAIVDEEAAIEKVVAGFKFLEGPVWFEDGRYLVFSDIPQNNIYRWDAGSGAVSVYLENSGFTGDDPRGIGREVDEGSEVFYNLGSNGVTRDAAGRIVFNAMGDRAIVRLEHDGSRTVLASRYQGMRLNSTNDLAYNAKGWLYFTDPPSGLRGGHEDPDKQLDYSGVFMLKDGKLHLLTKHVYHPNGLAFSPDGRYFFVNDNRTRRIYRFDLEDDGTLYNMQVFVDMTGDPAIGSPDGMKFDTEGNLYAAGAGGIWVISPAGEHLGTIEFPERASNMTFGGEDGRTLYVTARTSIYRMRVNIPGIRP